MMALAIRPEIVDRALAVVVDRSRNALAVWKGHDHIDLYDPSGAWHEVFRRPSVEGHHDWERRAVIAQGAQALEATEPPAPAMDAAPSGEQTVQVAVDDLERSWLVRAKPWGYAVWDGDKNVDVYGAEGGHLGEAQVSAADLATLSHTMLDLLGTIRRLEDTPRPRP